MSNHPNYRRPDSERVRRVQELRRSNAATPIRNKAKYNRKVKHPNKGWE